jgi:hypothetical protein
MNGKATPNGRPGLKTKHNVVYIIGRLDIKTKIRVLSNFVSPPY